MQHAGPILAKDEIDDFIMLRAAAFVGRIQRLMTRGILRDEGLGLLEWRILFSVARFGTCHFAHITQHTGIDPAHGSRASTDLVRKGLIQRHDDPKDQRRKLMSLTSEGEKVFHRIWPAARDLSAEAVKDFGADEFEDFKRFLDMAGASAKAQLEESKTEFAKGVDA